MSGGRSGGEGAVTLLIISGSQSCDSDILKAFHFLLKVVWFPEKKLEYQFFLVSKTIND